jgi:cation diffusion facilitator family transporter
MAGGSRVAIYAAAGGNLAIAASKFTAYAFTGSSAMLTEGIHSLVDTGNQGLLLFGLRRAARPPSSGHPFGHGMELYFWAFVVALMIFALGGAVSIYEGILKVLRPEPMDRPWINFVVLGAAIVFEGASFTVANRENRRRNPRARFLTSVRSSKDPSLFAVLLEDAAALAGLTIALLGVTVAVAFDVPQADGLASIGIGLLLTGVAVFMATETLSLMTGEAAAPELVADVRRLLECDPRVVSAPEILSFHLGPEDILLGITIDLRDDLPAGDVGKVVNELSRAIREAHPSVRRLFVRPIEEAEPPVPLAGDVGDARA